MSDGDSYTRLHITCPDGPLDGELFWAHPLGDVLYELRSTARYARHLNFLDVVRAEGRNGEKPEIVAVVHSSGHRTLWVQFAAEALPAHIAVIVATLVSVRAYPEEVDDRFYIVDVEPSADYGVICRYLQELERLQQLQFQPK